MAIRIEYHISIKLSKNRLVTYGDDKSVAVTSNVTDGSDIAFYCDFNSVGIA